MNSQSLLAFTLIILATDCARGNQKLNVSVFYETLCRPSVILIQEQLHPVWRDLHDYLNLSFVPYGKAVHNKDSDGRWIFDCQHGPHECYGNKIQACALDLLQNDTYKGVNYIHCFMVLSNFYPYKTTTCKVVRTESAIKSCTFIYLIQKYLKPVLPFHKINMEFGNMTKYRRENSFHGDGEEMDGCFEDTVGNENELIITKFKECVNSTKGDEILANYGDLTYNVTPSLTSVPALVINGVQDTDITRKAKNDFRSVICNLLDPKPAKCETTSI